MAMHGIVIDGSNIPDPRASMFDGDGRYPPFAMFDIDAQDYVDPLETRYLHFLTRETAQEALSAYLAGVDPAELPKDPLWRVPAGYRPLLAHEAITAGVLVIAMRDEHDQDNQGYDRVTLAGSAWIVDHVPNDSPQGDDSVAIFCYATGAAINPTAAELRDARDYRIHVHADD